LEQRDNLCQFYARRDRHIWKLNVAAPIFRLALIIPVRAVRLPGDTRMATYTVVPRVERTGFHVAVRGSDGIRQTILGFETRAEAEAWIDHDKRLSAAQAARQSTGSRLPMALLW
jgi:hypothetical protein